MSKDKLLTPHYLIDYEELEYNYDSMYSALNKYWGENFSIGYSVKTNNLPWILEYMLKKQAYAEVVSCFEYDLVSKIGFSPKEIIYNGPFKEDDSLKFSLENNSIVNVDSISEIEKIVEMGLEGIEILLRMNFQFEEACPLEISSDDSPSRFGISLEDGSFKEAVDYCIINNIKVVGIHVHQALKKRTSEAFKIIAKTISETIVKYNLNDIKYIDVGGGFFGGRPVEGMPTFDEYAKVITEQLKDTVDLCKVKLLVEPGVSLVSSTISYFTTVVSVKDIRDIRIVIVDGSILDINPFYNSRIPEYEIYSESSDYSGLQLITGSTCLENDRWFEVKDGKELKVGDIIEIKKCGGYTLSLNSYFINPPPVVYVKENEQYKMVRETMGIEKLF